MAPSTDIWLRHSTKSAALSVVSFSNCLSSLKGMYISANIPQNVSSSKFREVEGRCDGGLAWLAAPE